MASVHRRTNHWPWMVYYKATRRWRGKQFPPNRHTNPLYDCEIFRTQAKDFRFSRRRQADADVSDKEMISLFLEHRFLKAKKARYQPTMESACQAWNMFSMNYLADPMQWRKRLQDARDAHARTIPGMRLEIHRLCVEHKQPCLIVHEYCECCGPDGPKMPADIMSADRGGGRHLKPSHICLEDQVPTVLWNLYNKYEQAVARGATTSCVFDRNRTQGQERPRGGSDLAPMSHGRPDTLASERDTFADPFGLDDDGQGSSQQPTVSHHSRRGVAAVEVGRSTPASLTRV